MFKAMVFPVVMSGCEIWTINKAFLLKNWWFWIVLLERILDIPLDSEEIKPVNPKGNLLWIFIEKDWCWSWSSSSNTLASWYKELTHWKRLQCWERLKAGVEGDDRGSDDWMALPTWWTWVWASSGSWWWTGKPGTLQSTGSQRVRHDWVTEMDTSFIEIHSNHWDFPLNFIEVQLTTTNCILPTKFHLVKAMVFPLVMYGCESWTVKKAERGKINAFELWCWRRLLRVPWIARKSN